MMMLFATPRERDRVNGDASACDAALTSPASALPTGSRSWQASAY